MQRVPHVLDSVIVMVSSLCTIAANTLLAQAPMTEINYYHELRLLLLPLIGSMLVSGGMIMLNPHPETRKIVIGRSIIALFIGSLMPQLIGFAHPALQALMLKPVMLLAIGGSASGIAYALSRPFCRGLYDRADRIAKEKLDELEARARSANFEKETITIVKETPKAKPTVEKTTETTNTD